MGPRFRVNLSQLQDSYFGNAIKTVGASLLAMAVFQSTSMLDVSPSSRAGSLPQWFGVWFRTNRPAREQTLPSTPAHCGS
ncbi:hypothetical protein FQ185_27635 [Pseudomonas sp. ANT_H12B]|nr:hypothetical protein FQ185_27635 [Pseudomonas sp. ANT_H12B]